MLEAVAGEEDMKKTIRQMVAEIMYDRREAFTAKRICDAIGMHTKVKMSSLSSTLKRMADDELLLRVEGFGPLGGYGYMENRKRPGELRKLAGIPPRPPHPVTDNPIADMYMNHAGWRPDK
jgi:hypothetical protein